MSKLSHIDAHGNATMVDVSPKAVTERSATATGLIRMEAETLRLLTEGLHKKGDVLTVAKVAGIQAAKQCSQLIPLCHPLMLSSIDISLSPDSATSTVHIRCTCKLSGQTGVEMEALTAVSVAALTVYDMCKAVDRGMTIGEIKLIDKRGGKSGHWSAEHAD